MPESGRDDNGRPALEVDMFMTPEVEEFLYSIWRRFGHHSVDHLTRLTKKTPAYRQAFQRGRRSEIQLQAMRLSFTRAESTPPPPYSLTELICLPARLLKPTGIP